MSSLFYVRNTFGIAIKWKRVILNAVKNLPSLHHQQFIYSIRRFWNQRSPALIENVIRKIFS
jgi:hypothetical protein